MRTHEIEALVVGIPARDEESGIEACLRSVLESAVRIDVPVSVAVVADACSDGTAGRASALLGGATNTVHGLVEAVSAGRVSVARDHACRLALSTLAAEPQFTWIATTDADSTVPGDWLVAHLRWARAGYGGIAGLVRVADWDLHPLGVEEAFLASQRELGTGHGHGHVYAANLGMRGDCWLRCGGFSPVPSGEDHELWRRAREYGVDVAGVAEPVVTTSGRTVGRAPGGFASFLALLDAAPVVCEASLPGMG